MELLFPKSTSINDLRFIKEIPELEELIIERVMIINKHTINAIEFLQKLTKLTLSYIDLDNISFISRKQRLNILIVSINNYITSYKPLKELSELKFLTLNKYNL